MSKCLVVYHDAGTINIPVDRIEQNDVYIVAYKNNELVGMFPLMSVNMVYVSEKNDGRQNG